MSSRLFDELTDSNFELYAARHYDNPACVDVQEFRDDLFRTRAVKRHLRNYLKTGIIPERLVLNHVVTLRNVFRSPAGLKLLMHRMEPDLLPVLKPFLIAASMIAPEDKPEIPMDQKIVAKLRTI